MVTVSANVKIVDKWLKCQVNVGKIQRQLPFVYGNDFFDGQILIYACSIKHLRSGDTQVFLDFQMCLMYLDFLSWMAIPTTLKINGIQVDFMS